MAPIITSLVALSLSAVVLATPLSRTGLAPIYQEDHVHGTINDSYIIMLKNDLPPTLKANHFNFLELAHTEQPLAGDDLAGIRHVYEHFNAYAGRFSQGVIDRIRELPEVAYVECDQIVKTTEFEVHDVTTMSELETQRFAPWGLARLSHRPKLGFGTFTKYEHVSSGGEGVDVYVIDTGINIGHVDFEGRAKWGKTIPEDVDEDANGHGSHCAGTIAGARYGVAKKANVIAVKVLGSDGSGSMSDVVGGVAFAAAEASKKAAEAQVELQMTGKTRHKGSVANMSLGGGKSPSLDAAVNRAVDAGLHFAVAAGNDNKDACDYSPAAAEKAVTVGASTISDQRAYFSNYGKCVDIFGPGHNIQSTYKGSPYAIATLSGTSMASPHVAGLLAYLLSIYPHATFDPVANKDILSPNPISLGQSTFSLYTMARSSLPSRIARFLPSLEFLAPVPGKPTSLSTKELKSALMSLASEGLLEDVGRGSPNLLMFNNATVA